MSEYKQRDQTDEDNGLLDFQSVSAIMVESLSPTGVDSYRRAIAQNSLSVIHSVSSIPNHLFLSPVSAHVLLLLVTLDSWNRLSNSVVIDFHSGSSHVLKPRRLLNLGCFKIGTHES